MNNIYVIISVAVFVVLPVVIYYFHAKDNIKTIILTREKKILIKKLRQIKKEGKTFLCYKNGFYLLKPENLYIHKKRFIAFIFEGYNETLFFDMKKKDFIGINSLTPEIQKNLIENNLINQLLKTDDDFKNILIIAGVLVLIAICLYIAYKQGNVIKEIKYMQENISLIIETIK